MARKLAESDVHKIAALARLELTPAEVELFAQQLADILAYAETVQEVETGGVPPTLHPLGDGAHWREDEPQPSLDRETVLRHAPGASTRAGLFKVPKVL